MEVVTANSLFISEPNPYMFGNPSNAPNKHWTNDNWLKSRFHFAFAEYRDTERSSFGALRVMNDDLVQPSRGFGSHPHSNVEIVTYVVDGELTHKDSTGNVESLGRGSIQFMSAGKGLVHSESNDSEEKPCRFIQMWFLPRRQNLDIRYGSFNGVSNEAKESRRNQWYQLVSDIKSEIKTPVKIHQDVKMFVTELENDIQLSYVLNENRVAYVLIIESEGGATEVETRFKTNECRKEKLVKHDAFKVLKNGTISFLAPKAGMSHILLIDLKKV